MLKGKRAVDLKSPCQEQQEGCRALLPARLLLQACTLPILQARV